MSSLRKYPDPVLLTPAEPVDIAQLTSPDDLVPFFREMLATMQEEGGVGIAAPQIGISKQLIAVAASNTEMLFLINPKITKRSGIKFTSKERCLSCGDVTVQVKRDASITVQAIDAITLQPITIKAKEHLAAVLQHEIDHIHGKTLLNRK